MALQSFVRRWITTPALLAALAAATLLGGGCKTMTPQEENSLGAQQAPQFLAQGGGRLPDPMVNQYIAALGQKLVSKISVANQQASPWEFFVLNSSVINAFAIPGGKVFVSRGLLEKLDNEAEVAAVLGHEMGHVLAHHIAKQMGQQGAIETGLGVIQSGLSAVGATSNTTQWVNILGSTGGKLYLLHFSRSDEAQADRYGLDLMTRAGYDPQGMIGVLQVLQQISAGGGGMEFLSTHPDPANRLIQARDLIKTKYAAAASDPNRKLNAEEYRPILQRLRQLPPPADVGKK